MKRLGLGSGSFSAFPEPRPCASPTQLEESGSHLLGASPTEHTICAVKDKGGLMAEELLQPGPRKELWGPVVRSKPRKKIFMLSPVMLKDGLSEEA